MLPLPARRVPGSSTAEGANEGLVAIGNVLAQQRQPLRTGITWKSRFNPRGLFER